jgi:hypothetical protein
MSAEAEQFYELLGRLSSAPGQGVRLSECTGEAPWPARGVYFFREPGEHRASGSSIGRVTRVGTHAVSVRAKSTLWSRLRAHRGARDGSGNHRGSVFRRHVCAALLRRGEEQHATWAIGSSAPRAVRTGETELEMRVSQYLGAMTVLWIAVPDEPGAGSQRAFIERNAIALLSNQLQPRDLPSAGWLGLSSAAVEIRESGLWNVKHVRETGEPGFLDVLEEAVVGTVRMAT